jgi:DNA-binding XRE family transcriptional regulator
MDKRKKKQLESSGWKLGSAKDFLGLSDEEHALVELKLGLANAIKETRIHQSLTQQQLAKLLGSSQSRVAKMEAAEAAVSIDLMMRCLLRMGASRRDLGSYIADSHRRRAA